MPAEVPPRQPIDNFTGKAKITLVSPDTMTAVWSNEASGAAPGTPLAQIIPLAEEQHAEQVLAEVASTGEPAQLRAVLVSTGRGGLDMATSVYRLPDGLLLVVTENAFKASHDRPEGGSARSNRTPTQRGRR